MIDDNLHKSTKYRIPQLLEQFKQVDKNIGSYIFLEKNWDSYDGEDFPIERIQSAHKVLWTVYDWFKHNIGFLNNRIFKIYSSPIGDGRINIEINYDCFVLDIMISDSIIMIFMPECRHDLDGEHTIADRHTNLIWSIDEMNKEFKDIKYIKPFLNEAFYKHKWKF